MTVDVALRLVAEELERARGKFPAFHSGHEGIAVIQEEVAELWAEVKRGKGLRQSGAAGEECLQIAAMALRFLLDLCVDDSGELRSYIDARNKGLEFSRREA